MELSKPVIVGLVVVAFVLVVSLPVFFIISSVRQASRERRKKPSPGPWMDHPEWAAGRMEYRHGALAVLGGLWVFVLAWNGAIGWVIVYLATAGGPIPPAGPMVMLGIGGVIGLVLLVGSVRATVHAWKFRKTLLVLQTCPAFVGERFAAECQAPEVLCRAREVRFSLRCEERHRSASGSKTGWTEVHWRDEAIIEAPFEPGAEGVRFPVSFDIPAECPAIGEHGSRGNRIDWVLEASADLPGVDFTPTFSVPVYRREGEQRPESAHARGA